VALFSQEFRERISELRIMNIIDCVNGALEFGVVGGGTMGLGIAQVAAQRSLGCAVLEVDPGARERARSQLTKALTKADERGKLAGTLDEALGCITWAESVKDLADCGVVIEAIPEIKEAKLGVFADLDEVCSPRTILASNTSSIPIAALAAATTRPGRVVGLHFFNPVPAMPLVEVVASLTTDDDVAHAAEAFVRDRLGKQTIRAKDQAGFVVNAIFVPYLLSAIRSLDNGVASAEDIDAGMVGGCGMPMGPLALCDLIGLDTMLLVADSLHTEYQDPATVAPSLLRRHVDAGWLGKKTGRGFYDYTDGSKEG